MLNSYPSKPPIPIFSGVKSDLNRESPFSEEVLLPPSLGIFALLKFWPGAGTI
jgi:hypothetical protein